MPIKPKYLYLAIIIYTITAYFSLGHLHPDEYYQILEFAAYKLHLNSPQGLTWEFYYQIRPTVQALVVVYLYKLFAIFSSPNPFFIAFITRVIAGTLSLISVYLFIQIFIQELGSNNKRKWFILLSIFSWLAVFNGIRYSSENISAKIFIIGMSLLFFPKFRQNAWGYLFIGLLLGLSFIVRFQVAFMIAGLLGWLIFIDKIKFRNLSMIVSGVLLGVLCGTLIDYWFYGDWVFTPWRYFNYNILKGMAASFSVDPWYLYLLIIGLIPYGILYILASIYFMFYRRTHVITWVMLPFIMVHLLVEHKELRFLTPLLTFMPFVILDSLQILKQKYDWQLGVKLTKLNKVAWYINCALVVVVMFTPPAMQLRINKQLYKQYNTPTSFYYITEGGNVLDFYKHPNMTLTQIKKPSDVQCPANQNCLIALTCIETLKYGAPEGRLIFSDCPKIIFKLDFNNWLERTALYNIYELKAVNK